MPFIRYSPSSLWPSPNQRHHRRLLSSLQGYKPCSSNHATGGAHLLRTILHPLLSSSKGATDTDTQHKYPPSSTLALPLSSSTRKIKRFEQLKALLFARHFPRIMASIHKVRLPTSHLHQSQIHTTNGNDDDHVVQTTQTRMILSSAVSSPSLSILSSAFSSSSSAFSSSTTTTAFDSFQSLHLNSSNSGGGVRRYG